MVGLKAMTISRYNLPSVVTVNMQCYICSVTFDKTRVGARRGEGVGRMIGVGVVLFRGEALIAKFGDGKGAYSKGELI